MLPDISADDDSASGAEAEQSECAVAEQDQRQSNQCQKKKTALQQLIKRETENKETHVDSEERVQQSEMYAIAEAEIGIPLRRDAYREEQPNDGGRGCDSERENSAAQVEVDSSAGRWRVNEGNSIQLIASVQCLDCVGGKAKIDPEETECAHKRHANHGPLNRQKRPEDAKVVKLPHPEPFLDLSCNHRQCDDGCNPKPDEIEQMSVSARRFGGKDEVLVYLSS
jgi:hypothetical protein